MDIENIISALKPIRAEPLLGLDIGSNSIKLIQLNSNTSPSTIEYFTILSLPSGLIEKDAIKNPDALADLLKTEIRKLNIPTKGVAIAVPRSAVIIKNITVDARLSNRDIESRAWIEAAHHFPDLINEVNLDYSILGPVPNEENKLELVLIACRKNQINPYLDLLNRAGLTPKIVDVNCYALERTLSLEHYLPQQTIALLNVDFNLTSLIVMQNNVQIYAHDYSFDANNLFTQLSNTPDIELQKKLLTEQFNTHLRHCIHFFYSSRHNIDIQKIILSGDLAVIASMTSHVQNEMGIETSRAETCRNMTLSSTVNKDLIEAYAPALALCCGLALSQLKTL